MTNDLAREDLAIGKVCQTYQACFSENSLIILLMTLAWPLGVFMGLINLDEVGLVFLSGIIFFVLIVRYFPVSKRVSMTKK